MQAQQCDPLSFRERGITHILLLGLFHNIRFLKTVQLHLQTQVRGAGLCCRRTEWCPAPLLCVTRMVCVRVRACVCWHQDVDTYNFYTHFERVYTFVDEARRIGKLLVIDKCVRVAGILSPCGVAVLAPSPPRVLKRTGAAMCGVPCGGRSGKSEALTVAVMYLMRLGFQFDDAERILLRSVLTLLLVVVGQLPSRSSYPPSPDVSPRHAGVSGTVVSTTASRRN